MPEPVLAPAPAPEFTSPAGAPPPGYGRIGGRKSGERNFSFIPDEMPERYRRELVAELEELEEWANLNARDAKRDSVRFWVFKIPAILASSCAGAFGYFGLEAATVVSGAIGSICVLVDGVNPGGRLRNVHVRAVHDLRQLQNEVKGKLRYAAPVQSDWGEVTNAISELVHTERRRIGGYLREAESALGEARN